jgi:anthranilate/para-aminobenzoate synthase component II
MNRISYIDNYDSYSESIIDALYRQNVCVVQIYRYGQLTESLSEIVDSEGVVLGPGSGNPHSIYNIHQSSITQLMESDKAILGICLGFQIICTHFGIPIVQLATPHHGEVISGKTYYNSFGCRQQGSGVDVVLRQNVNDEFHEFYHVTRPIFAVQYHPESVYSETGLDVFAQFIAHAKPGN